MSRRLALLVNPAASGGRALALAEPVRQELERAGADFSVAITRDREHALERAHAAAAAGEAVVALGGDGFVGLVAGALCTTGATLGIIPAGRGNDFARVLGIPSEPAAAARVALTADVRAVDVAAVNGRSFVGIASAGFDSEANRIANEARLVRGNLVYVYAALRALAGWHHARFEVTVDGVTHTATGYSVAVANSKAYGGGMLLVPHAEVDDGTLEVMITEAVPKLRFLRTLPKVFKGAHVSEPGVRFLRGRHVELRADRPFTVYADGDPIAELPAVMTVSERVLKVIAP